MLPRKPQEILAVRGQPVFDARKVCFRHFKALGELVLAEMAETAPLRDEVALPISLFKAGSHEGWLHRV